MQCNLNTSSMKAVWTSVYGSCRGCMRNPCVCTTVDPAVGPPSLTILILGVDDLFIPGSRVSLISNTKKAPSNSFAMNAPGDTAFILEIQISSVRILGTLGLRRAIRSSETCFLITRGAPPMSFVAELLVDACLRGLGGRKR